MRKILAVAAILLIAVVASGQTGNVCCKGGVLQWTCQDAGCGMLGVQCPGQIVPAASCSGAATPTPTPALTPTATPTPTPQAQAWTWEVLPTLPRVIGDGRYEQNCVATVDEAGVAIWDNRGWFHWPSMAGDFEETGYYRYPTGGTPSWNRVLRSGQPSKPFDAYDTHECGSIAALGEGDGVLVVFDRTTLSSLPNAQHPQGCAENRIFNSLAAINSGQGGKAALDAPQVHITYDWQRPWRPDAGRRCGWTTAGSATALTLATASPAQLWQLVVSRPGGSPPKPAAHAAALAAATPAPTPTPIAFPAGGNIGWENALYRVHGVIVELTYDSSVPGGPWVAYQVQVPWRAPVLMGPLSLPTGCQGLYGGWMQSAAVGIDGRPRMLWTGGTDLTGQVTCPTGTELWPSVCKVRELVATDAYGLAWEWSGREWTAPAGKAFEDVGYVVRLSDGVAWPGVLVAVLGTGPNPPDPASRWELAVGYEKASAVPFLADLRKVVAP